MHVGAFVPFWSEHTKYVVVELGLLHSQSFTHRQLCFLIVELVTFQVLFEQPNKFYH